MRRTRVVAPIIVREIDRTIGYTAYIDCILIQVFERIAIAANRRTFVWSWVIECCRSASKGNTLVTLNRLVFGGKSGYVGKVVVCDYERGNVPHFANHAFGGTAVADDSFRDIVEIAI